MFLEAIAIDSAEERASYLDKACAADADLRASVETLLKAHTAAGEFLEAPALADAAARTANRAELLTPPGTVIGRYKLWNRSAKGATAPSSWPSRRRRSSARSRSRSSRRAWTRSR